MSGAVAVVSMTTAEAEAVTSEIRAGLVAVWDNVAVAYHGRAWVALAYDSWDDYCECEFDGSRIRIPREQRQEVVSSLRDEGLSLRAIAAATGTSYGTVQAEDRAGDQNRSPAVPPLSDVITDDDIDELRTPEPKRTTGLDGKTYARPTPPAEVLDAEVVNEPPAKPAQRRRPLTEGFRDAAYDLTKVTERIERLAADDRFPQNAGEIAARHRNDLTRAIDALQGVSNRLPSA